MKKRHVLWAIEALTVGTDDNLSYLFMLVIVVA